MTASPGLLASLPPDLSRIPNMENGDAAPVRSEEVGGGSGKGEEKERGRENEKEAGKGDAAASDKDEP